MPFIVKNEQEASRVIEWTLIHSCNARLYYQYFKDDAETDKRPSFFHRVQCFFQNGHNYKNVVLNYGLRGYRECEHRGNRKDFRFRDTPFSHMD